MRYLLFTLVIGRVLGDTEINFPPKIYYDLNEAKNLFDKYVVQFNKQYDDDEYITRLAIFKENLEEINKFNQESNLTVYDINQFTDLKYEEITNSYMGLGVNVTFTNIKEDKTLGHVPKRLDYREKGFVTEVKNQGQCGSCYIFSAVGSIEGQHAKVHGALISLSEQQAFDCQVGGDCNHGDYPLNTMSCIHLSYYGGGIFSHNCVGMKRHAVLLVGYDTSGEIPYWIIKNSWNTVWGHQGYLYMEMGKKLCDIGSYVAVATVA